MTNLAQRVLMFFIFVPLIAAVIIFLPEPRLLALQIAAIGVTVGLTFEVARVGGLWPLQPANLSQKIFRAAGITIAGLTPLIVKLLANFDIVPEGAVLA